MSTIQRPQEVPCRPLHLGDVVTKPEPGTRGHTIRGVVTCLDAHGTLGHRNAKVTATSGYRGTTTYTDFGLGVGPDEWQLVPWDRQTWEERILSTSASWQEPGWAKDPDGIPYDPDSYGWALFETFATALRPTSEDGFDWPTSWLELALDFARRLDGELESTGVLIDRRGTG